MLNQQKHLHAARQSAMVQLFKTRTWATREEATAAAATTLGLQVT
jgi:hypothetical protein